MAVNRFFNIKGDVSLQLAPWELESMGKPVKVALFELKEEIRFRSDIAGGVIVVPVGYLSDLASIPQFAWSLFMATDDPRIELGGWIHDVIYSNNGQMTLGNGTRVSLSRKQADRILTEEAMPDLMATPFQRAIVYQALRRFGKQWKMNSFWERFT